MTAGPQHTEAPALLVEDSGEHVTATLNRPAARNAINAELVDALHALCLELERAPKVLVLAGAPGIFAAGADIRELRGRDRGDALRGINSGLFHRLARLPLPTIAVIDGPAIGGGAELAYACDFRIGTARTRFGNPEPSLGILAAAGACWRLVELVGEPVAKDILLGGRILDADEARAVGLLTQLVADVADLADVVAALLKRISAMDPLALRLTKAVLRMPRSAHPAVDDIAQAVLFETEEKKIRMDAFLERSTRRG